MIRYTISVLMLTLLILSGKPALAADDHEHTVRVVTANAGQQSGILVDAHRAKPRVAMGASTYGANIWGMSEPLFFNIFKLF